MPRIENFFTNFLQHRLGRHLLFWFIIYVVFTIAQSSFESQPYDLFTIILLNIPGLIAPIVATYFLNYYLIPKYLNSKRFITFGLLFVLSAYLICVFARIINVHFAEPLFRQGVFYQETVYEIAIQFNHLITVYFPEIYFIAFAMAVLKQQRSAFKIKQRNILLEKEKARTELNFLKAQIHPHFLFNTLNSLYVLTLIKSEKAPETVIKLSEILDYILYKGSEDLVSMDKEIKLLENYISLEKLRYGDELKVTFLKEIDDVNLKISPLLLLSIVENAFKHGASGSLENPKIKISLKIKNNRFLFEVFNTKTAFPQKDDTKYRKGIGISNIKRQLALTYLDYEFEIEEGVEDFFVKLSISLDTPLKNAQKISREEKQKMHPVRVQNEKIEHFQFHNK